jgi:hypothetical protein
MKHKGFHLPASTRLEEFAAEHNLKIDYYDV